MSNLPYKIGDRVLVTAPDHELFKYEGFKEAYGTILRFRNGKVRVEIDGTASQDTEGNNCYGDFDHEQVKLIAPANSFGVVNKENTDSTPPQVAVSPGVTVSNITIRSGSPAHERRNILLSKALRLQQAINRGKK